MTPLNLLTVMIGGAAGAGLRFCLIHWVVSWQTMRDFPYGTLAANIIGSFLIGVLAWVFIHKFSNHLLHLFFIVGLLGSFTTVSSFSLETVELFLNSQYLKACLNIITTIVLCLSATMFGLLTARNLMS